MTHDLRSHWLFMVAAFSASSLLALGCGDDGNANTTDIPIGPRPPAGCLAPQVPADEPRLVGGPAFAADFVPPGNVVEAQFAVSGNTRNVEVALTNIWQFGGGDPPLATQTAQTRGDETLTLEFATETTTGGRFFLEIALCPDDCADMRYVYTLDPADINTPYIRITFEGDREIERTNTCIQPPTVVID